jgi:hypothetical protein
MTTKRPMIKIENYEIGSKQKGTSRMTLLLLFEASELPNFRASPLLNYLNTLLKI